MSPRARHFSTLWTHKGAATRGKFHGGGLAQAPPQIPTLGLLCSSAPGLKPPTLLAPAPTLSLEVFLFGLLEIDHFCCCFEEKALSLWATLIFSSLLKKVGLKHIYNANFAISIIFQCTIPHTGTIRVSCKPSPPLWVCKVLETTQRETLYVLKGPPCGPG